MLKPKFKKDDIIIEPSCGCKWVITSVNKPKKQYRVKHNGDKSSFGWNIRDCELVCKKYEGLVDEEESNANGTVGILIFDRDEVYFRVYNSKEDWKFTDYKIVHPDLQVEINDSDAFFKKLDTNNPIIDVSNKTLGIYGKQSKSKH